MKDAKLILPKAEYLEEYLGFCTAIKATGITYFGVRDPDKYDEWKDSLFRDYENERNGVNQPEGWVPSTQFWLVSGDKLIGACNVRHWLVHALREFGGHIGYAIHPNFWQQGYGTLQLQLALLEAKKLGIDRALVTCDVTNLGSARVIEKNGGILEGIFDVTHDDKPCTIKRYWIDNA